MRRKILAGGMTLVMVGVLLGACGVPQEDLDAAEDALAAAEAETVAAQDDIDAAELATRLATDSIATLQADLATAQETLAELQAVEDAIAAAKAAEEAAAAAAGTYTNEEYGFTVTYPLDLEVQEVDSTPDEETGSISLFTALGPWSDPGVYVSVSDVVEGESYVGTFAPEEGEEGTDYVIVSNTQVETSDGSTGSLVQYTYTWDIYPLNAAGFAVEMDGELIIVSVSSGTMGLAALAEMATTLTFTGDAAGLGTAPDDEGEGEGVVPGLDGEVVEDEVVEDEVVEEVVLSFEAETYTNDDYGVSYQYPSGWIIFDSPPALFTVYAASYLEAAAFTGYAIGDAATASELLETVYASVVIESETVTTTADGSAATEFKFTYADAAWGDAQGWALVAATDTDWLVVTAYALTGYGGSLEEELALEIVGTLTLTAAAEEEEVVEDEVVEDEVVEDEVVEDGDAAAGALEALVTTFDSTLWTSEEYGIEVNYPTAWEVQELTGEANDEGATLIFSAGVAPYNSPAVTVSVADIVEGESHTDANIRGATEPEWVTYEVTSEDATTTRDGTAATILTVEGMWDVYPVPMYELRAEVNGQYITVNVAGTAADAEEIVRSLTITGAAAGGDAGDAEEEAVAADCPPADLSYTPTEYANAELGFTVQYDGSFWTAITESDIDWQAIDTTMYGITGLYIAWSGDVVEGESYADYYAGVAAEAGDTDFVLVSDTQVTTCDGTAANRIEVTINWGGAFAGGITSYAIDIDGKWVVVSVVGGPGWDYMDDQTVVDEVLDTWTFN